jgi:hypothetical protein
MRRAMLAARADAQRALSQLAALPNKVPPPHPLAVATP